MNYTKKDILKLVQETKNGSLKWERSDDQDCCSTLSTYSGSGYVLCLFNRDVSNEFIVFEALNEFGYYLDQSKRYFPGDDIYEDLKQLSLSVDEHVKIVDLQP